MLRSSNKLSKLCQIKLPLYTTKNKFPACGAATSKYARHFFAKPDNQTHKIHHFHSHSIRKLMKLNLISHFVTIIVKLFKKVTEFCSQLQISNITYYNFVCPSLQIGSHRKPHCGIAVPNPRPQENVCCWAVQ